MADIIVNVADESITDLDNAVVVMGWHQGDLDNDDTVNYAAAHGKSLAELLDFVRNLSRWSTSEEVIAELDDPDDPDQVLEAEQEQKQESPDLLDNLILKARGLV